MDYSPVYLDFTEFGFEITFPPMSNDIAVKTLRFLADQLRDDHNVSVLEQVADTLEMHQQPNLQ